MANERKGKLLTVEVDPVLYEAVKQLSKQTGIAIAFKVREALEAWAGDDARQKQWDRDYAEVHLRDRGYLPGETPVEKVEKDFDFGA